MASINTGRVVLGGLLAGLVINLGEFLASVLIFADAYAEMMEALGLAEPGGTAMALFVIMGFLGGMVMVWVYAGIRPRFGAGPKTAAMAGLVAWILWYFFPTVGYSAMGMYSMDMTMILMLVWGLVEFQLAAQAGAWFYQESQGGTAGAPTM